MSEPANAQLIGSGKIQKRKADCSPAESHSAFEPHPIQGWTPDFIPLVLQESIDKRYFDELVPISGAAGIEWSAKLARREGILTGISGGASFGVAMQIAEKAQSGSVILCMLPDTGERYLSSPLFEGIPEYMTEDEYPAVTVDTRISHAGNMTLENGPFRFDAPSCDGAGGDALYGGNLSLTTTGLPEGRADLEKRSTSA